jgi:YHS domain-containing protein
MPSETRLTRRQIAGLVLGICTMSVDATAVNKLDDKGKTYYFCTNQCKQRFEDGPERALEVLGGWHILGHGQRQRMSTQHGASGFIRRRLPR